MREKLVWGLILIWFCTMIIFFLVATTRAEKVELQWDYDGAPADGFHIYFKADGEYADPAPTIEYPDGNIPPNVRQVTVDLPVVDGDATNYVFIARTFLADELSEPSNKVFYTVVGIPPLIPTAIIGSYDKAQSIIHVAWEQPQDDYDTHHWRVYARLQGEQDFEEIGLIRKDQGLELTTGFNLVPAGAQEQCEFVVVSYRRSGVYSANSDILLLDIDRRMVDPVKNLRINIEIPVN